MVVHSLDGKHGEKAETLNQVNLGFWKRSTRYAHGNLNI